MSVLDAQRRFELEARKGGSVFWTMGSRGWRRWGFPRMRLCFELGGGLSERRDSCLGLREGVLVRGLGGTGSVRPDVCESMASSTKHG